MARPVQARLEGAERRLQHRLELLEAVSLDVVHRDHRALLGVEPVESAQDALALPAAFGVLFRAALRSGQCIEGVVLAFSFGHELHDRRAGPLADRVDVLVVEHPGEPRAEPLDLEQLLGAGKELDQYVLDEVLGVGHAAGESPGEPIEVLYLRAQQILEIRLGRPRAAVRRHGGSGSAEWRNRGHNLAYTSTRPKRFLSLRAKTEFVLVLIRDRSGWREPLSSARSRLGSLFFTVPRRCVRLERVQQVSGTSGDLVDGLKECSFIAIRGSDVDTNFPHELQGGRANLFVRHGRFEVEEGLDVSAHKRYLDVSTILDSILRRPRRRY